MSLAYEERLTLKQLIDRELRRRKGIEADGILHGKYSTYRGTRNRPGCRCDECRQADSEARAQRRANLTDEEREEVRLRDNERRRRNRYQRRNK